MNYTYYLKLKETKPELAEELRRLNESIDRMHVLIDYAIQDGVPEHDCKAQSGGGCSTCQVLAEAGLIRTIESPKDYDNGY